MDRKDQFSRGSRLTGEAEASFRRSDVAYGTESTANCPTNDIPLAFTSTTAASTPPQTTRTLGALLHRDIATCAPVFRSSSPALSIFAGDLVNEHCDHSLAPITGRVDSDGSRNHLPSAATRPGSSVPPNNTTTAPPSPDQIDPIAVRRATYDHEAQLRRQFENLQRVVAASRVAQAHQAAVSPSPVNALSTGPSPGRAQNQDDSLKEAFEANSIRSVLHSRTNRPKELLSHRQAVLTPPQSSRASIDPTSRPLSPDYSQHPLTSPHKNQRDTRKRKAPHTSVQQDFEVLQESSPRSSQRLESTPPAQETSPSTHSSPTGSIAVDEEISDQNMGVIRKKTATRGGEGGVKYHCDVCSVDVTSTVRIRCAEEICGDYDLCVSCFSKGESNGNHKPETHSYHVIEQNSFPIFDEDWGADEELLLLEGAETYGLGSWADIADHIGGFRNKDEVRDHYYKVWVESSKFPLPERCSPEDTRLAEEISREGFQAKKKRRIEERKEAAKNAPALQAKTKPTASVPSCHEIQGYMPGRLEFETEHANEAEEAVQLMQFDPGDGINPRTGEMEPEMELKMTVMDIYNERLTQRVERKHVIFEHNLLDYRENIKQEKKRSKEEREILNKAKPFARILNREDFEDFCQGLLDEYNLKTAITQLQEWRNMGIGDLRSGEKYEQEKAQRAQKAVPMGSLDRERLATAQRNKANAAVPDPPSGAALLVAPELPIRLAPQTNGVNGTNGINGTNGDSDGLANGHADGAITNGNVVVANDQGGPSTRQKVMPAPIPGITPLQLTQESAPDLHLLTFEETKLCEVVRLQPKPYLMIKEQILKEAIKGNGTLKKKQVKEICRLDTQKGGRIFDFFVNAGWIGRA